MSPPKIVINGTVLDHSQSVALALAVKHWLDSQNDPRLRAKCKGVVDEIGFDLRAVMAMLERSLVA